MEDDKRDYVFDVDKLKLGDIILAIYCRRTAKAMEYKTGSPYHHAMIVAGYSTVLHSFEEGVHSANPQRELFEREDDAIVVRLKDQSQQDAIIDAINSIRLKIGMQYSSEEMNRVLRMGNADSIEPNRQFCTRLVAQAYRDARIPIVENADYCTPAELLNSDKVEIVSSILRKGSPAHIAYAKEGSLAIDAQTKATNEILKKVQELTGRDIQSLKQVEELIGESLEFDQPVTEIVIASGYLDLYKMELEKNVQDYRFQDFKRKVPKAHWLHVAQRKLTVAENMLYGAQADLERLSSLNEKNPRAFYEVHIALDKNLIAMFSKMERTMSRAIKEVLK